MIQVTGPCLLAAPAATCNCERIPAKAAKQRPSPRKRTMDNIMRAMIETI